ncbi:MAG: translational GTPase TypA [Patescibacteria group bacterium]|nr:translational GTPase TypA [Patescibacteria group bacterium]
MNIRNIAIIAHVDHGKTTLIDGMLKQTHLFRDNQSEMSQSTILDSGDLEREKGITILAKNTAVLYKDYKINIIDTPGHADFSGEVERVINMADGALLVVDSAEGPLPQTRFVLEQAFKNHLKMIVVINKIDKKLAEPQKVLAQTEELFVSLADDAEQLNFPVVYASGIAGKSWLELPSDFNQPANLVPLFDTILDFIPAPQANATLPFKMQVANIDFDSYKGTYAIGKVLQGTVKIADRLNIWTENEKVGDCKITHLFTSKGLERVEVDEAYAGDIIFLTGIDEIKIGQTLADPVLVGGLPTIQISEPTLKIQIAPNSSPFAGREGEFGTVRQLAERLRREKKTNIGLKIEEQSGDKGFIVSGRGELHLAVLIESMRREGYEMEVSKPQVIYKEIDGQKHEPVEQLNIRILQEYMGVVTEELGKRLGLLQESLTDDKGVAHMTYRVSSRNLLGFRSSILSKTRGNGLFDAQFLGYFPVQSASMKKIRNGVLVATETGQTTAYALISLQERGLPFMGVGEQVYAGMIVGLGKTYEDIDMNACKAKKLTNFRSNADIAIPLDTPMRLSLEQSLDFIEDDELLELTPISLRLRKKILDKNQRYKRQN